MNERESYQDAVIKTLLPFLNSKERDSRTAAENFIKKFSIKDIKAECMVRCVFNDMAVMTNIADLEPSQEEMARNYVGFVTNILIDIAMDDWDALSERLK